MASAACATDRGLAFCANIGRNAWTDGSSDMSSFQCYQTAVILRYQSSMLLAKSFASEASGDHNTSKPIKKGLSAGTVPPAAEQVPPGAVQQKDSHSVKPAESASKSASGQTTYRDSATVGQDRPSASAIPAGVDQIPPSSHGQTNTDKQHASSLQDSESRQSSSQSQQPMQSVLSDISEVGKLGSSPSTSLSPDSAQGTQEGVSRWQRFKWWIWGTPQKYWTDQSSKAQKPQSSADTPESKAPKQRSGWFLESIFESAIMRTGVIKDKDVAR